MRLLVSFLTAALALYGQVPRLTEVQERRLANGARLGGKYGFCIECGDR